MNLAEKLQEMRVELQSKKLKKSGKNEHLHYEYFELQDFIPEINKLMLEKKVTSRFFLTSELATLRILDAEDPAIYLEFTCPMAKANLSGCQEVQNLGASMTYIRRYLYVNAFEIVDADILDKQTTASETTNSGLATDKQLNLIEKLAGDIKWTRQEVHDFIADKFVKSNIRALTKKEASSMIDAMQEMNAFNQQK